MRLGFTLMVKYIGPSGDERDEVTFTLEVDLLGDESWAVYDEIIVPPDGYSAQRICVRTDMATKVTAYFMYR